MADNPVQDPQITVRAGAPISENTPDLASLAFPFLFHGKKATIFVNGNSPIKNGQNRKTLRRLMTKAQIINGKLHFPFQEDDKFQYWCQNMIMRAETLYNASVYIKNLPPSVDTVETFKKWIAEKKDANHLKDLLKASL